VLGHRRADARPQPRPVPAPMLPTALPRVSILIPTRNQVHLLRTCLESLGALTDYPDVELIVIDNGSDEPDALAYLATLRARPGVQVLPMPLRPFNFSALNNRAAEQASGELLLLLNNDIEVIEPHWLRAMVAQALRAGVGAVGARLLYPDRTLQHGGVVLGLGRDGVASPAFKGLPLAAPGPAGRAQCLQAYSAVTAACLLVRKSLYQQVGGLDETHLAVAYNDVDFCLKLRAAGLRNLWTPQATLIHHESVSRGRDATAANSDRFATEAAWMRERWGAALRDDPAYNPNLNGLTGDFALAEAPRVSLARPWFLR
jgi:O-antigen biosynthesis protein